jgi:hypothetical protein
MEMPKMFVLLVFVIYSILIPHSIVSGHNIDSSILC